MTRRIPLYVKFVLFFQILIDLVVVLDLPVVREIVGFVYLTFVPGFMVLKALRLGGNDNLKDFLFSVGVQLALLMFSGLSVNIVLPIIGVTSPLSTIPVLLIMNAITFVACVSICLRDERQETNTLTFPRCTVPLMAIPMLSIVGALISNVLGINMILFLMLITVAGLIVFGTFHGRNLQRGFYPLAILTISVALIFHTSLAVNYISGYDIYSEYHVFELTNRSAFWNASYFSYDEGVTKGNAMLSVTILPTIYAKITGIDPTWLMKILYPTILSLVPLVLYRLYRSRAGFGKSYAFLAVIFLVVNSVFFETDGFPAKQMVGEFFYVLLFLVVLSDEPEDYRKNILFVIFGAGLVVSHYSMSYILLFLIAVVWTTATAFHALSHFSWGTSRITIWRILILSVMTFGWYIYTTNATPFNAILGVGERVTSNFLTDFFNPSSRSNIVLRGLGAGGATSFGHQIGRGVFYLAEFFIAVGVINALLKKKLKKFGPDYAMLSILSLVFLVMCVAIPNFAAAFRAERFYQVSLLFLTPFFALGAETLSRLTLKRTSPWLTFKQTSQIKSLTLALMVLVPFLLFETGFIYEATGDISYSVPLSKYEMERDRRTELYEMITDESEIAAASWLHANMNFSTGVVYGDYTSVAHVLTAYGMIPAKNMLLLTNTTVFAGEVNYVYLREVNTVEGTIKARNLPSWNISAVTPLLVDQNVIFSTGEDMVLGGS